MIWSVSTSARSSGAMRPARVRGGGAAPKFGARHQDGSARVLGPVQDEIAACPPVIEEKRPVTGALDPFQKLLGDDLVGVDVGQVEWRHAPGHALHRVHHMSSRTSTRWPVRAAAAAIGGRLR